MVTEPTESGVGVPVPQVPKPPASPASQPPSPTSQRASQAAKARWQAQVDWESILIEDGLDLLAELRAEGEKAGLTLQRRISEGQITSVKCYICKKDITPQSAKGNRVRNNFQTGIPETAYACSAGCYIELGRAFEHPKLERS